MVLCKWPKRLVQPRVILSICSCFWSFCETTHVRYERTTGVCECVSVCVRAYAFTHGFEEEAIGQENSFPDIKRSF